MLPRIQAMVKLAPTVLASRSASQAAKAGLQQIVEQLCEAPEIALARIWLVQRPDECEVCLSRCADAVPEQSKDQPDDYGLHLIASAGQSRRTRTPEVWDRLDGRFHRFPLNSEKIGRIGATGKPLLVHHHSKDGTALSNPDWLSREGIESFFGCPLLFNKQTAGVFAIFSRLKLTERELRFLKQIADGALRLLTDAGSLAQQQNWLDQLEFQNRQLRKELEDAGRMGSLVTCDPASQKLSHQIELAAGHLLPVLVRGERGVGKEFVARLIHQRSRRQPLVKVDGCSLTNAFFDQTFAGTRTELHEGQLPRRLESGDRTAGGTLFIDAVEQIPLSFQERLATQFLSDADRSNRLLRSLRIITSSAVDLQAEVAAGRFRNDLHCILSVSEITVPALRQRSADLPVLATNIVDNLCRRMHQEPMALDAIAMSQLALYDWPGNVRELESVLNCAVIRAQKGQIDLDGILNNERRSELRAAEPSFLPAETIKLQERANIIACLRRCDWRVYGKGGAAELLHMKPTTLMYRLKVLGIRKGGE